MTELFKDRPSDPQEDGRLPARVFWLKKAPDGFVVVSGYQTPQYIDWYESKGWRRVDRPARTNGGPKIESIWLSPTTWAALQDDAAQPVKVYQRPLFSTVDNPKGSK